MNLENSVNLKELPDLSNATNLERLKLDFCFSLVEIPSSVGNLQKLESLDIEFCVKLQVVPTHLNLASLESVNMLGCYQLRKFPDIFRNIRKLVVTYTMLQDSPESIRLWSRLQSLFIVGSAVQTLNLLMPESNLKSENNFPDTEKLPDWNDWVKDSWVKRASYIKDVDEDIKKIPDWIKDLDGLEELVIAGYPKLASLPELPTSLKILKAHNCESLETLVPFPFESPIETLHFTNCLKLGQEARRVITQQSRDAWLPGRNVPEEFNHRAIGNSLTIPSGTNEFRYCVVISPKQKMKEYADLMWRLSRNGFLSEGKTLLQCCIELHTDHLFVSHFILPDKLESDALLEFSTTSKDLDVIECGFQIFTDQTSSSYESISEQNDDESLSDEDNEFDEFRVKRLKT